MSAWPKPMDPLDESDRWLKMLDEGFPQLSRMSPLEARQAIVARARPITNIDDVASTEDVMVGGTLRLRIYRPHNQRPDAPAIVFAHGGGFVFGSIEGHDSLCRRMARHTGAVLASVEYRLAPEHRAPAAAEDTYAALQWVADNADKLGIDAGRILVGGDSAGGNLATVAALMSRDRGGPAIAGQILLYPVIAPDFETESYRQFGKGCYLSSEAMQWFWWHYLGGEELPEPKAYIAPLYAASLHNLPPSIVVIPGRDPLSSEGRQYADALRDAGVKVRLRTYPDLFHGFLNLPDFKPAAAAQTLLWSDINALISAAERK